MSIARHLAGALLAAVAAGAVAQQPEMRDSAADSIDFTPKPFDESKIKLPAPPKTENLVRFDAGPTHRGFEHFVDAASLSLDTDGVLRYTLIINSDLGASNVTYEGIRCVTRERKIYAYGLKDGAWRERKDPEWKKIENPRVEGAVFVLYNDFFCPARHGVSTAREALAALKAGGHPRASDEEGYRQDPLSR